MEEYSLHVLWSVKHADDLGPVLDVLIEDDVVSHGQAPQALPQFVPATTRVREHQKKVVRRGHFLADTICRSLRSA